MTTIGNKEYVCWNCNSALVVVQTALPREYYTCPLCNPSGAIEECIDGCLLKCKTCAAPITYGNYQEVVCTYCQHASCQSCAVLPDDDNDVKGEFCSVYCLQRARSQGVQPKRSKRDES